MNATVDAAALEGLRFRDEILKGSMQDPATRTALEQACAQ